MPPSQADALFCGWGSIPPHLASVQTRSALWRTGGRQVCFLTHAPPACLPSRFLYRLGNPGVEAFALGLGGCGGSPVDLWRDPEGDLPGEWLIWSPASFFADLQVVVDRKFELLPELVSRGALEKRSRPRVSTTSPWKTPVASSKVNRRSVSFVFHHRSIPASFRNRLTESTTPFRASFSGWGLWK